MRRGSPWRATAGVLALVCSLQCVQPTDEGLFEALPAGSAGTAMRGAVALPALPPSVGIPAAPTDNGGSGASPGENPPPGAAGAPLQTPPAMGAAASPQQPPPLMGAAGAPGMPDLGGPAADAGVAPVADCVLGAFQPPEPLTGLEQAANPAQVGELWAPSLSAEGSTLFFAIGVPGVDEQIASATRGGRGTAFGPGVLARINSAGEDGTPLLSADGRSLYFYSTRAGGLGNRDVWLATRADASAEFAAATLLAGVNGPDLDHLPWVSQDELTLLWVTNRSGGMGQLDIWSARRSLRGDGFSNIAPLNGVNSTLNEGRAVLSNDELTIYFASERPGGLGTLDLWVATRQDRAGTFSQVTNLASLNSSSLDQDPVLSADERELIFSSGRDGRIRLWRSVRDCE
jgi:hypothetical protein